MAQFPTVDTWFMFHSPVPLNAAKGETGKLFFSLCSVRPWTRLNGAEIVLITDEKARTRTMRNRKRAFGWDGNYVFAIDWIDWSRLGKHIHEGLSRRRWSRWWVMRGNFPMHHSTREQIKKNCQRAKIHLLYWVLLSRCEHENLLARVDIEIKNSSSTIFAPPYRVGRKTKLTA